MTTNQQHVIDNIVMYMTANEIQKYLTKQQITNLRKLAEYLVSRKRKPAKFDMEYYTEAQRFITFDTTTECGSVGCAVGHGPYAGIPKLKTENWEHYANRVFCNNIDEMFSYLFDSEWHNTWLDNTALGAGKRILFMLKFGLPYDTECVAYKKFSVKDLR